MTTEIISNYPMISGLLEEVIKDVRLTLKDDSVRFNMPTWFHKDDEGICTVCIAGAVLYQKGYQENLNVLFQAKITEKDKDLLYGIDCLRRGDLSGFFHRCYQAGYPRVELDYEIYRLDFDSPSNEQIELFCKSVEGLIEVLKGKGL